MKKIILVFALLIALFSDTLFAQDYKEYMKLYREGYKSSFTSNPTAPLKAEDMINIHFYEPDEKYVMQANIELITNSTPFKMPTYDGSSKEFIRYATATGKVNGKNIKLTLYKNLELSNNPTYKDYLFLPFTDLTNDKETYGGGRYMDFRSQEIENGKLIIDFNKAYNPYCAYSTGYRCPVPPEENNLNIKISAGERKYTGAIKNRII